MAVLFVFIKKYDIIRMSTGYSWDGVSKPCHWRRITILDATRLFLFDEETPDFGQEGCEYIE
jgi:hypothetical protein